jgi:hypothetical protein
MQHEGIFRQLHSEFSGCKVNGAEIEAFSDDHVDDDNKHGHKGVALNEVVTRIANIGSIPYKRAYCNITVCQEFSVHEPTKSSKISI